MKPCWGSPPWLSWWAARWFDLAESVMVRLVRWAGYPTAFKVIGGIRPSTMAAPELY